jgi:hypothetical protein
MSNPHLVEERAKRLVCCAAEKAAERRPAHLRHARRFGLRQVLAETPRDQLAHPVDALALVQRQ